MPKNNTTTNPKGKRSWTANQTGHEDTEQDAGFLPSAAKKTKLNVTETDDNAEHYLNSRTDENEEVAMDEDEAAIESDLKQSLGYATESGEDVEADEYSDEDYPSEFDLEQQYQRYQTEDEQEGQYQVEDEQEEDLHEIEQIQFNSPKEAKDKLNEIIQLLKSNPDLRALINDNPYLTKHIGNNDSVRFLEKLFKKNTFDANEYEIIQEVDFYQKILQDKLKANFGAEDIEKTLLKEALTSKEIMAKFQKIIYLLENNNKLHDALRVELNVNNLIHRLNNLLNNFSTISNKIDLIKSIANTLEAHIEKKSAGKNIDILLMEIRKKKMHVFQDSHFEGKEAEIAKAHQILPEAEVERRKLLHENIQHEDISRFQVLDEVATILRKYRDDIKQILGPDARIKFRGSLVRGLKGYPKSGVAPTLDSYDCDAFIEVPDEWWSKLKKLRPGSSNDEDGKVRIKPLRDYESLSALELGIPGSKPQAILEERVQDEKQMQINLDKLIAIETAIKSDIAEAKLTGKLQGYAENENGIDFDFYLRPIAAVKKTYLEGNPYTPEMIMDRGFASYAAAHETQEIPEFRANVDGQFKRTILPVALESKDGRYKPEGIILEEYQVVIGRRGWYIEDQYLFEWRKSMHAARVTQDKIHASRQGLPVYQEPLPPVQRDYKDQQYKDLPADRGNTLKQQAAVNSSYELFHKRKLLFWHGPKKAIAKDHPVMQLGEAKEIIGCIYNDVETFNVNKVKELKVPERNMLKEFFEEAPKDLIELTKAFLKNEEHPLYVQELIITLEKCHQIPAQEKRADFFEEIIKTLKEYKENQTNYDLNQILVTHAKQYKQNSEQDTPSQRQRSFNPDGFKGV